MLMDVINCILLPASSCSSLEQPASQGQSAQPTLIHVCHVTCPGIHLVLTSLPPTLCSCGAGDRLQHSVFLCSTLFPALRGWKPNLGHRKANPGPIALHKPPSIRQLQLLFFVCHFCSKHRDTGSFYLRAAILLLPGGTTNSGS